MMSTICLWILCTLSFNVPHKYKSDGIRCGECIGTVTVEHTLFICWTEYGTIHVYRDQLYFICHTYSDGTAVLILDSCEAVEPS